MSVCDHCHAPYQPAAHHQRFCSRACCLAGQEAKRRALSARHAAIRQGPCRDGRVDRSADIETAYRAALRDIRARARHEVDVWAQAVPYASQMAPCGPPLDDEDVARV